MLEIVKEVSELMNPLMRVNDRTIYFTDIYVIVFRTEIKKNKKGQEYKKHTEREVEIKGQCYEIKPLQSGKELFWKNLKRTCEVNKKKGAIENIDTVKIILRKELTCSIYKD